MALQAEEMYEELGFDEAEGAAEGFEEEEGFEEGEGFEEFEEGEGFEDEAFEERYPHLRTKLIAELEEGKTLTGEIARSLEFLTNV